METVLPIWRTLEDEDVNTDGFLILTTDGKNSYIAPAANSLFPSHEAATTTLTNMVAKGMPIGFAKVIPAKLSHKRHLQVEDKPEVKPELSKLIIS